MIIIDPEANDNYNPVADSMASDVAHKHANENSAIHGCCTSSCTEVGPKYGVFIGV